MAVWRISSSNKSSGNTVANKQVENACNKQLSDKTICKFAASFKLNTAYKAVATTSSSDGSATMTIAADGKGNTSLTSNAAGQELDSITLGTSTYIKDSSSGTWLKYTTDSTNSADSSNPANNIKFSSSDITANNTISYKNLGNQACGKLTCYYYQVTDSSQKNATQYIWFDTKDYQLQHWYFKDANGTTDMTFTYQAQNITAPSPVQDASASTGASATPSQTDINAAIQAAQNAAANSAGSGQ